MIRLIQQRQIACDVFIHPGNSPLHAGARVIPGFAVHCLELTAVDGHHSLCEQLQLATQSDELSAYLADGLAIGPGKYGV